VQFAQALDAAGEGVFARLTSFFRPTSRTRVFIKAPE
jgi:hypothetical protein